MKKLGQAKFAVTCTLYNQRYLRELAARSHLSARVYCVYHGINLDMFTLREERMPAPPYNILTVARFVEKKGLDRVLQALALLRDQGLDFRYTLIGGGDLEDVVKQQVQELNLESHVDMPGVIPQEQVLEHYLRADLFVIGCRVAINGDRDGIPNVIAECMARGVPVVATDVSGIPELLEHERTGLLVPDPSSAPATKTSPNASGQVPQALARAIRRMLEDDDLRKKIIPQAREKVQQVFDNQKLIRDLADIYRAEGLSPKA